MNGKEDESSIRFSDGAEIRITGPKRIGNNKELSGIGFEVIYEYDYESNKSEKGDSGNETYHN